LTLTKATLTPRLGLEIIIFVCRQENLRG
jgi:hypothetical protein